MQTQRPKRKLGVIVNPIAGIGGRLGLKGSDGAEMLQLARQRGGLSEAPLRAQEALAVLTPLASRLDVLTWAGPMGETVCRQAGFTPEVGGAPADGDTSGADTEAAARWMESRQVDLLLFAGGDGTARNVCAALGERLPVLGVPAGVKIHSAVFGLTPKHAGMAARAFLEQHRFLCRQAEVMDIDEDAFRRGEVRARLYGCLQVPDLAQFIQGAKMAGGASEAEQLAQIAHVVAGQLQDPAWVYLIGPGTTTHAIKRQAGIDGTLLGVDVVWQGRLVAKDADERTLLEWVGKHAVKIVVTIIGGQGYLFGRGNQQISPSVIRAAGRENIIVVATQSKLQALMGRPLVVDTGDALLDQQLHGYLRVVTGADTYSMCRVGQP